MYLTNLRYKSVTADEIKNFRYFNYGYIFDRESGIPYVLSLIDNNLFIFFTMCLYTSIYRKNFWDLFMSDKFKYRLNEQRYTNKGKIKYIKKVSINMQESVIMVLADKG